MAASTSSKPVVVVFGATGAQGGSVAETLLGDGTYAVRAVTRNPESEKAQALAAKGAEVVKADMSDKDELLAALTGAHGVFLVTQFWEKFDADLEKAQGKLVADAAKEAGVQHMVFSSLEDTRPLNKAGELNVDTPLEPLAKSDDGDDYIIPHFDAKGAIKAHIESIGLPATFVQLSFYLENFLGMMPPQKQDDGSQVITMPMADAVMGFFSVADTGGVVLTVLKNRSEHLGKTYGLAGSTCTVEEAAAALSEGTGAKFVYNPVTREAFAGFGFPGAEEMARMFSELYCTKLCVRDAELTRKLNPATKSIKEWAEANKAALTA